MATRSISIRTRRHVQLPPSLSEYIPDMKGLRLSSRIHLVQQNYTRVICLHLYNLGFEFPIPPASLLRLQPSDLTETETETETEEMMLRAAASRAQKPFPLWVRSSSSTHRTADPALHSGDTEGSDSNEEQAVEGLPPKKPTQDFDQEEEGNHHRPHQSSSSENFTVKSKLESHPVNIPIDPNIQQKRHFQSTPPPRSPETTELEKVSCVGFDGTPLPMDENEEERINQDDKEFFKDRKPSALSEIEIADTRKPITRAIDGTADGFDTREIEKTGWREEQIDTAEEALRRASLIWKEASMRGDPDAPQSRVLRQLLAERGDDFCLN